MTQQQAAGLVARLLSGYPYLNLAKPDEYSKALGQVLTGYPFWVGEMAIRRTDSSDNPQFLPSDRQLRKWCDELIAPAVSLERWNQQAALALPPPTKPAEPEPSIEERAKMAFLLERKVIGIRDAVPSASGHMQRVLADIEARKKSRNEEQSA